MTLLADKRPHYPALDGLRGIAILLVVLSHNFKFIPLFNYGWLGVDLFFVLSGFLITNILVDTIGQKNYFKNFYIRRALRIFPLYYLSLLLFLFILPLFKEIPLNLDYTPHEKLFFFAYIQNWLLIVSPHVNTYALGHYWSLGVEEQFYIIWPLIIWWLKSPKKILILLLLLLAGIIATRAYIWIYRENFPAYYNIFLLTRIDGLLLGSILAIMRQINPVLLRQNGYKIVLGLACFNFLYYFLDRNSDFLFPYWSIAGYTTFAALFAILVYEAITKESRIINFVLTINVLRFLGKYSYGFYIFHWAAFLLTKPFTDRLASLVSPANSLLQLTISSILATGAGLIVSIISYHGFEKYFLNLKKKFT